MMTPPNLLPRLLRISLQFIWSGISLCIKPYVNSRVRLPLTRALGWAVGTYWEPIF